LSNVKEYSVSYWLRNVCAVLESPDAGLYGTGKVMLKICCKSHVYQMSYTEGGGCPESYTHFVQN
jgi:hypothetical protein